MLIGWRRAGRAAVASRSFLLVAAAVGIYLFAYFWRLGSLVSGASGDEQMSRFVSSSMKNIWQVPINAPYSILQHFFLMLHISHLTSGRITSALLMAFFTVCLYYLIKNWFGRAAGVFGAIFFLTNPYSIILGRTGSPLLMMFWLVVIAAAFTWMLKTERRLTLAWIVFCISCGVGLYVPGLIWPLAITLIFLRFEVKKIIASQPRKYTYIGGALLLLMIFPLIIAILNGDISLKEYLWLPRSWPSVLQLFKYLGWSILAIFIKAPKHNDYILGHSPMLSIAEITLVVFGLFALTKRLINAIYMMLVIATPIVVLAAINQDMKPLFFLLPLASLLSAVGVRFLYIEWRRVFPLNPLPRVLAIVLVSSVIIVHVVFGLRYALVAWPHNPEIKQAYMLK